ncbi:MAG: hypothetical protein J6112_07000 [Clostridia bacterium]|nr:hypothetical protein [Clostridia bacterium]
MQKGAGPWQGIEGDSAVLMLRQFGLFTMFVTVCCARKHARAEICYSPVVRRKAFQDPAKTMRCSQWDMMINATFEIVRESIEAVFGKAESESNEEEESDGK